MRDARCEASATEDRRGGEGAWEAARGDRHRVAMS